MTRKLEVIGLTKEVLERMYLEDLLTETQIGNHFGIGQVQVGRIRKRFGIPTMSIGDRVGERLPQTLTKEQQELLVGSLLGDGWMSASSPQSAGFNEGHCTAQAEYTKWKAEIMGAFTSRLYPTVKRDKHGKEFHALYFGTHSCPQLRPYYDLFYPAPNRQRVFPACLPQRMTPFVLAVWYMDDGDLSSRGFPGISFGLDDVSLQRALKALRTLGLSPKVYGEGRDRKIAFPKQSMKFKEMVEPYLLDCMKYKIPFETTGQAIHRKARELTSEEAGSLYANGVSVAQIAKMFGVGTSTVGRRLAKACVPKRTSGPRRVAYTLEAADRVLGANSVCWYQSTPKEQDVHVRDVLKILRSCPFPYFPNPDRDSAIGCLSEMRKSEMRLDAGEIQPRRRIGVAFCSSLFPNRYKAQYRNRKSAYESWHLDSELNKAIRFQFKVGDPVTPSGVLRALMMQCRTPTVFRPSVAKFIYERYCPRGGVTWDPCSGYGGRLLGALAAGVRYVGTDVDVPTIDGNQKIADMLGLASSVTLTVSPAEKFDPPSVDLVFTSPPYYNCEIYSGNSDQSWNHGTFDRWLTGFLFPVVRKAMDVLVPNGYLVLNIADVRVKNHVFPLVSRVTEYAEKIGFTLEDQLRMPLSKLNKKIPYEPVLVFHKMTEGWQGDLNGV